VSRRSARPIPPPDLTGPCPCGLDRSYPDCCGSLHDGRGTAATAQALMRSRYSAFAVRDAAYLLRSWHPTTRPPRVEFDDREQWTGLVILGTTGGSLLHAEGTVEFRASYRIGGRPDAVEENSRFLRVDGQWTYLGPVPSA
jgi:SEC-C motif domain protein